MDAPAVNGEVHTVQRVDGVERDAKAAHVKKLAGGEGLCRHVGHVRHVLKVRDVRNPESPGRRTRADARDDGIPASAAFVRSACGAGSRTAALRGRSSGIRCRRMPALLEGQVLRREVEASLEGARLPDDVLLLGVEHRERRVESGQAQGFCEKTFSISPAALRSAGSTLVSSFSPSFAEAPVLGRVGDVAVLHPEARGLEAAQAGRRDRDSRRRSSRC